MVTMTAMVVAEVAVTATATATVTAMATEAEVEAEGAVRCGGVGGVDGSGLRRRRT